MASLVTASRSLCILVLVAGNPLQLCDTSDGSCNQEEPEGLMSVRSTKTTASQSTASFKTKEVQSLIGGSVGRAAKIFDTLEAIVGVTPEVKMVIQELINDIDNNIFDEIKSDFGATQQAITDAITQLVNQTNKASEKYVNAVAKDSIYVDCVATEEEIANNYSSCMSTLAAVESLRNGYCASSNSSQTQTYSIPTETFVCNFKTDDDCVSTFTAFESKIARAVTSVRSSVAADNSLFEGHYSSCSQSAQAAKDQDDKCENTEVRWTQKTADCESKDGDREIALCAFGFQYQAKCRAEEVYSEIYSDATTPGTNQTSEDDRQAEWRALFTVKCMLQAYMDHDDDFTNSSLANCQGQADQYASEVGTLDYKTSEAAVVYDHEHFNHTTCSVGSFTFSGSSYDITPASVDLRTVAGTTYERNFAVSEVFDTTAGNKPLAMC